MSVTVTIKDVFATLYPDQANLDKQPALAGKVEEPGVPELEPSLLRSIYQGLGLADKSFEGDLKLISLIDKDFGGNRGYEKFKNPVEPKKFRKVEGMYDVLGHPAGTREPETFDFLRTALPTPILSGGHTSHELFPSVFFIKEIMPPLQFVEQITPNLMGEGDRLNFNELPIVDLKINNNPLKPTSTEWTESDASDLDAIVEAFTADETDNPTRFGLLENRFKLSDDADRWSVVQWYSYTTQIQQRQKRDNVELAVTMHRSLAANKFTSLIWAQRKGYIR